MLRCNIDDGESTIGKAFQTIVQCITGFVPTELQLTNIVSGILYITGAEMLGSCREDARKAGTMAQGMYK